MKTMLLSFKPKWFEKIQSGEKKFEYRNVFPNEEVIAYMYVSSPIKSIVGKIHLGEKRQLHDLKRKYTNNREVVQRLEYYSEHAKVVMPILSFQMTKAISLDKLREFDSLFVCPQMYYYLDDRKELLEFITENARDIGEKVENDLEELSLEELYKIYR